MEHDGIAEAARLTRAAADLLQRAASIETNTRQRADARYAEALARTLLDLLAEMDRSATAS